MVLISQGFGEESNKLKYIKCLQQCLGQQWVILKCLILLKLLSCPPFRRSQPPPVRPGKGGRKKGNKLLLSTSCVPGIIPDALYDIHLSKAELDLDLSGSDFKTHCYTRKLSILDQGKFAVNLMPDRISFKREFKGNCLLNESAWVQINWGELYYSQTYHLLYT